MFDSGGRGVKTPRLTFSDVLIGIPIGFPFLGGGGGSGIIELCARSLIQSQNLALVLRLIVQIVLHVHVVSGACLCGDVTNG